MARNGKALPDRICQWSSSSPAVASVSAAGNSVLVTAVGQGAATVRCKVGGASGEVAVSVRVIGRLEVLPPVAELKLQDEATPFPLEVKAFDAAGQPASPRLVRTTCKDENVCRGDDRGQLWPAGAGKTRAWVEADGVATEIEVRVADARTAAGKPKAVKGNPMLEVEKAVEARDREERRAAQKKEKETKK